MNRAFIITLLTFVVSMACVVANAKTYRVTEIHGQVTVNGKTLVRGNTLTDESVLSSQRQSIVKVTDSKNSYSLKLKGSKTVKSLIESIPNKYEAAIEGIKSNLDKSNRNNIEYGMVTMGSEETGFDLHENEAFALCKEDSLGNLSVTFMRHGMDKPMKYNIDTYTFNQLLRMNIITAKGYDYAYTSTTIYNTLWKPMEKYLKEGDLFIYSITPYLSDIDMTKILVNNEKSMGEMFEMISLDGDE